MTGEVQSADYVALLEAVKVEIGGSRVRAARVIERLAADLGASFPPSAGSGAGTCTTCGPSPRRGRRKCHSLWQNFPGGMGVFCWTASRTA